jgi:hypothetical protein
MQAGECLGAIANDFKTYHYTNVRCGCPYSLMIMAKLMVRAAALPGKAFKPPTPVLLTCDAFARRALQVPALAVHPLLCSVTRAYNLRRQYTPAPPYSG